MREPDGTLGAPVQPPVRVGHGDVRPGTGEVPVTVVIPAYNEARRLTSTVPALLHDRRWPAHAELLLVDDGSHDATAAIGHELLRDVPGARLLQLPWHAGKGSAVGLGVAAARGRKVVFMDADLATDLDALPDMLTALDHADVVVGTRVHPEAVVSGRTPARELLHRAFRMQVRRLTGVRSSDPQCGFKGFRTDAAKVLFHLARTDGFGFDVEILMLAQRLGLHVAELPVSWRAMDGSKVRVLPDAARMSVEVMRARMRHLGKRAEGLA
jgi:glycosyltransferase involved in cell wall biosynthesis